MHKTKIYTELESGVPGGYVVDNSQVKNAPKPTSIVQSTGLVKINERTIINVTQNTIITLEPYEQDGYTHAYEIILNIYDTEYSISFPESIKWTKELEILPNTRYNIIIEDNIAMWVAVPLS